MQISTKYAINEGFDRVLVSRWVWLTTLVDAVNIMHNLNSLQVGHLELLQFLLIAEYLSVLERDQSHQLQLIETLELGV
jgi:hypothetical protein